MTPDIVAESRKLPLSAEARADMENMIGVFESAARILQIRLKALGRYDGAIDGDWGPRSRGALAAYRAA